jgi:hypothetical protein
MTPNFSLTAALWVLLTALTIGIRPEAVASPTPVPSHDAALQVDVWTDRGEGGVYRAGEEVSLYFQTSDDCYLTIYDIDTEGRVRLLFPQYPDEGFVFGGMTYRIPDYYDRYSLRADGPAGVEFIHAVASREARFFRRTVHDRRYDFHVEPIAEDPFVAINRINGRLIPSTYIDAIATTSFFVESRVWYPRYMCNSCHVSGRVRIRDPYADYCPRYTAITSMDFDYWWLRDYRPMSTRFVFSGPFWRFEFRTGRYLHHQRFSYLDCAIGHGNYHPMKPPRHAYSESERKSPRDTEFRNRERTYTRVRYEDMRTRIDGGVSRSRTLERSSTPDAGSRDRDAAPGTTEQDRSTRTRNDAIGTGTRGRDVDASSTRTRTQTAAPAPNANDASGNRERTTTTTAPTVKLPETGASSHRERETASPGNDRSRTHVDSPKQPQQGSDRSREQASRSITTGSSRDRVSSTSSPQDKSNATPRDRTTRASEQRSR